MRTDLYTKTVLTVIAACLVYLCLGRPTLVPHAQAQEGQFQRTLLQRVVIAGWIDADGRERRLPNDSAPGGTGPHALPVFSVNAR
jgi:hypothetical protein